MDGAGRRVLTFLTWVTCRLAHRVICVSESLRLRAIECGVVDQERAVVLGAGSCNGLDERSFAPTAERTAAGSALRERLGIPPSSCVIGFVGRIALDKGVGELAAAWRVLRQSWPELHWIVVGREDDTDPVPAGVLAEMAADPRCHLVGHLDDVAIAYAAMDLLVLPTYREGFGNVLIEAAAMERPTVATEVTGCVDAVEDGVTGTLVPPRDPAALAAAIDRYVADPDLRHRHGSAGAARARLLFGQQVLWDRKHGEYRRLLNGTAR
jgi:glycosyltransferase involved in cell wall biosynthesis